MDTVQFDNAKFLLEKIQESDAILVGAAAGFSAADGKHFWYEADKEFQETFRPFIEKYGIQSAFDGFYYPFKTPEEHWGYLATLLHHMYESKAGQVYKDLKTLLQDKPYHIMTTNQDFLFFQDFPEKKVSVIQGDQRWFQRADGGVKDRLFENKEMVYKMFDSLKGGRTAIPTELIPRDPEDGTELMPWVRHPGFLEKSKYQEQYAMIRNFLDQYKYKKILFLELGVGRMTPMFIQEPFWQLTYQLPFAYYISVNPKHALLPEVLEDKGRAIHEDIKVLFEDAVEILDEEKKEGQEA